MNIRIISVLLIAVVSVGCIKPDPPLRVGVVLWPPFELAHLAQTLGYYDSDKVEIVEYQSPAEAVNAFHVKSLDIVALTMDFHMELNRRGLTEHKAFLLINESRGGDAVLSHTPMSDLQQLKGKRIGLESGPLGNEMLTRLLEHAGLERSDVELEFVDIPDQAAAFVENEIDVVITYEPTRTNLVQQGAFEIFSTRDIPGEIIDAFFTHDSLLETRLDDLQHFSEGWFMARQAISTDQARYAALLAPRVKMTEQDFINTLVGNHIFTLEENRSFLSGENEAFNEQAQRYFSTANDITVKDSAERFSGLFNHTALPGVQ